MSVRPLQVGSTPVHLPSAYDRFDSTKRNSWLDGLISKIQQGKERPPSPGPSRSPSPLLQPIDDPAVPLDPASPGQDGKDAFLDDQVDQGELMEGDEQDAMGEENSLFDQEMGQVLCDGMIGHDDQVIRNEILHQAMANVLQYPIDDLDELETQANDSRPAQYSNGHQWVDAEEDELVDDVADDDSAYLYDDDEDEEDDEQDLERDGDDERPYAAEEAGEVVYVGSSDEEEEEEEAEQDEAEYEADDLDEGQYAEESEEQSRDSEEEQEIDEGDDHVEEDLQLSTGQVAVPLPSGEQDRQFEDYNNAATLIQHDHIEELQQGTHDTQVHLPTSPADQDPLFESYIDPSPEQQYPSSQQNDQAAYDQTFDEIIQLAPAYGMPLTDTLPLNNDLTSEIPQDDNDLGAPVDTLPLFDPHVPIFDTTPAEAFNAQRQAYPAIPTGPAPISSLDFNAPMADPSSAQSIASEFIDPELQNLVADPIPFIPNIYPSLPATPNEPYPQHTFDMSYVEGGSSGSAAHVEPAQFVEDQDLLKPTVPAYPGSEQGGYIGQQAEEERDQLDYDQNDREDYEQQQPGISSTEEDRHEDEKYDDEVYENDEEDEGDEAERGSSVDTTSHDSYADQTKGNTAGEAIEILSSDEEDDPEEDDAGSYDDESDGEVEQQDEVEEEEEEVETLENGFVEDADASALAGHVIVDREQRQDDDVDMLDNEEDHDDPPAEGESDTTQLHVEQTILTPPYSPEVLATPTLPRPEISEDPLAQTELVVLDTDHLPVSSSDAPLNLHDPAPDRPPANDPILSSSNDQVASKGVIEGENATALGSIPLNDLTVDDILGQVDSARMDEMVRQAIAIVSGSSSTGIVPEAQSRTVITEVTQVIEEDGSILADSQDEPEPISPPEIVAVEPATLSEDVVMPEIAPYPDADPALAAPGDIESGAGSDTPGAGDQAVAQASNTADLASDPVSPRAGSLVAPDLTIAPEDDVPMKQDTGGPAQDDAEIEIHVSTAPAEASVPHVDETVLTIREDVDMEGFEPTSEARGVGKTIEPVESPQADAVVPLSAANPQEKESLLQEGSVRSEEGALPAPFKPKPKSMPVPMLLRTPAASPPRPDPFSAIPSGPLPSVIDEHPTEAITPVAEFPDPYEAPPDTQAPAPLSPGQHVSSFDRSPSLIVEPPLHPPKPDSVPTAITRAETPTLLPDPSLPPPDATIPPPLSPGQTVRGPALSPSVIVEPPENPPEPDSVEEDAPREETPTPLPDPHVAPPDSDTAAPDVPHLSINADTPNPSIVVEPPTETLTPIGLQSGFPSREDTPQVLPDPHEPASDTDRDEPDVPLMAERAGTLSPSVEAQATGDIAEGEVDPEVTVSLDDDAQSDKTDTSPDRPPPTPNPMAESSRMLHHHGPQHEGHAHAQRQTRSSAKDSTSSQPPVTRSHCFYRKLRLQGEGGLSAEVLVPQCTLFEYERLESENSKDLGEATEAEEKEANGQAITENSPLLHPHLVLKLHRIVGNSIFDEGHCFLLSADSGSLESAVKPEEIYQTPGKHARKRLSSELDEERGSSQAPTSTRQTRHSKRLSVSRELAPAPTASTPSKSPRRAAKRMTRSTSQVTDDGVNEVETIESPVKGSRKGRRSTSVTAEQSITSIQEEEDDQNRDETPVAVVVETKPTSKDRRKSLRNVTATDSGTQEGEGNQEEEEAASTPKRKAGRKSVAKTTTTKVTKDDDPYRPTEGDTAGETEGEEEGDEAVIAAVRATPKSTRKAVVRRPKSTLGQADEDDAPTVDAEQEESGVEVTNTVERRSSRRARVRAHREEQEAYRPDEHEVEDEAESSNDVEDEAEEAGPSSKIQIADEVKEEVTPAATRTRKRKGRLSSPTKNGSASALAGAAGVGEGEDHSSRSSKRRAIAAEEEDTPVAGSVDAESSKREKRKSKSWLSSIFGKK